MAKARVPLFVWLAWCVLMGAGGKLMPLTQQPSFEAVKTLDVRPSTRAGNSKTTSYIPRRVLYTEPWFLPRRPFVFAGRHMLTTRCCAPRRAGVRPMDGRPRRPLRARSRSQPPPHRCCFLSASAPVPRRPFVFAGCHMLTRCCPSRRAGGRPMDGHPCVSAPPLPGAQTRHSPAWRRLSLDCARTP